MGENGAQKDEIEFVGGEGKRVFKILHLSSWIVHIVEDIGVLESKIREPSVTPLAPLDRCGHDLDALIATVLVQIGGQGTCLLTVPAADLKDSLAGPQLPTADKVGVHKVISICFVLLARRAVGREVQKLL